MAILSKTWWRSLVKGDENSESNPEAEQREGTEGEDTSDDFLFEDLEQTESLPDDVSEVLADGAEAQDEAQPGTGRPQRGRRGGRERGRRDDDTPRIPPRAKVASAKDFFTDEAIYRFDIMEVPRREELKGDYRIEVKGNKGGVWTLKVDTGLEIVNRREDAAVVVSIQQKDFIQLVNGDLNPQMAILAQKMKVSGEMRSIATLQSLLVPPGFD
jgi:hypothetical protein